LIEDFAIDWFISNSYLNMALADNILDNFLPHEIFHHIFSSEYLSLQDISHFDVAICNHEKRPGYLDLIRSLRCIWPGDKEKLAD
jgi:hypothetical protein